MKKEIEWIEVTKETLPKPKVKIIAGTTAQTVSTELICYDGKNTWVEYYGFDSEDDTNHILRNVTYYIELSKLPTPC